jgi:hypothetical protein
MTFKLPDTLVSEILLEGELDYLAHNLLDNLYRRWKRIAYVESYTDSRDRPVYLIGGLVARRDNQRKVYFIFTFMVRLTLVDVQRVEFLLTSNVVDTSGKPDFLVLRPTPDRIAQLHSTLHEELTITLSEDCVYPYGTGWTSHEILYRLYIRLFKHKRMTGKIKFPPSKSYILTDFDPFIYMRYSIESSILLNANLEILVGNLLDNLG